MNSAWNTGVNSQASRLSGSAPGWAGTSGVGTGVGACVAPDAPGLVVTGAHAAATSTTRTTSARSPI